MTILRELMILVGCTALAAAGTQWFHPRAPRQWYLSQEPLRSDEVTVDSVEQKWHGDVLWMDARPRSQYVAGHVPGALSFSEQEAEQLMSQYFLQLQDNTKPIVVYCGSEACQTSRKMADYLRPLLPTESVYVLRGGWGSWEAQHGDRIKKHPV